MNKDKWIKYSILTAPIILFLMVFWLLKGVFILTTDKVRGVHLPDYATTSEEYAPTEIKKDTNKNEAISQLGTPQQNK